MTIVTILRLCVLPVFLLIAWSDYRTKTVDWRVWPILSAIGMFLIGFEAIQGEYLTLQVAGLSVVFFAALSYILRTIGTFGGADMWALLSVSVLYPVPILTDTALTVFPLTVFTNAIIFTAGYKIVTLLQGKTDTVPFLVPFTMGLYFAVFLGDFLLLLF